jgi:glutamate synthase (NADPH/NADH)
MKLDKAIVQRRLDLMAAEGIVRHSRQIFQLLLISFHLQTFVPNAEVGVTVDAQTIRNENDAVVVCTGATWPRDLKIPNRNVDGIHFAMEYLQVCFCFFGVTLSPD